MKRWLQKAALSCFAFAVAASSFAVRPLISVFDDYEFSRRAITLDAQQVRLSDLFERMGEKTGVTFQVEGPLAQKRVLAFCQNRPLGQVMEDLAYLVSARWAAVREGDAILFRLTTELPGDNGASVLETVENGLDLELLEWSTLPNAEEIRTASRLDTWERRVAKLYREAKTAIFSEVDAGGTGDPLFVRATDPWLDRDTNDLLRLLNAFSASNSFWWRQQNDALFFNRLLMDEDPASVRSDQIDFKLTFDGSERLRS